MLTTVALLEPPFYYDIIQSISLGIEIEVVCLMFYCLKLTSISSYCQVLRKEDLLVLDSSTIAPNVLEEEGNMTDECIPESPQGQLENESSPNIDADVASLGDILDACDCAINQSEWLAHSRLSNL